MRIGRRLFLAVLPAIVGLLTVAALAYFGEYARRAPEWLVVTAIVAATGSAVLAWRNTRYVAQRVEQLATGRSDSPSRARAFHGAADLLGVAWRPHAGRGDDADELDRIESVVQQLSASLSTSRSELATERERLVQERQAYVALVEHAVNGAIQRLDEVRLPLHILIENHFGELNENQEEMLGAARSAAEAVDARLLHLREVARIDLEAAPLRAARVRIADLVQSVLPALHLAASAREVAILVDLSPSLPSIMADRARLQAAITTLIGAVLQAVPSGGTLRMTASADERDLRLLIEGGTIDLSEPTLALATRTVRAHMGTTEGQASALEITFARPVTNPRGAGLRSE